VITWIYGQSKAGKTTLAKKMIAESSSKIVLLDGDDMRKVWTIGFSKEDRWENNLRIARLAATLESQGFDVIVATICPYRDLRKEIRNLIKCRFIYVPGGKPTTNEYPFEED
jgi:adenylylsulfate kinase